ncbi:protein tyrosine phosphatase [Isosphaeraceae bacterium EP7]
MISTSRFAKVWPWLVLLLAMAPAIWHFVDFPDDLDGEYPSILRPTFSARPPSAYRLAEPGDTIDRVGIYASAAGLVLTAFGWGFAWRNGTRTGLWPASFAVLLAAGWHASNPMPTADGWHGLGWAALLDPAAPIGLRIGLGLAAVVLITVAAVSAHTSRPDRLKPGVASLGLVGLGLMILRVLNMPDVEPLGYWPRWCFAWGLIAWDLSLLKSLPAISLVGKKARWGLAVAGPVGWVVLVLAGIQLSWYHRPLSRLKEIVPGAIYISAMPTYRGLEIAQERHKFKTIINLFAEDTPRRSPILPQELKFVRENGIAYYNSPADASKSDEFLDMTLALARDPAAWPILVHCHGCMDRTPAWVGIYKFVVQGKPLDGIFREIEAHRGHRPKASVTLLYNRVLPPRAPGQYAEDPTAPILREIAHGIVDPHDAAIASNEGPKANPRLARGVPGAAHSPGKLDGSPDQAKVPQDAATVPNRESSGHHDTPNPVQ